MSKSKLTAIIYAAFIAIVMSILLIMFYRLGNKVSYALKVEEGNISEIEGLQLDLYPALQDDVGWKEKIIFSGSDFSSDSSMIFSKESIVEWSDYIRYKNSAYLDDFSIWMPRTPEFTEKVHDLIVKYGGNIEASVPICELIDYYPSLFQAAIGGCDKNNAIFNGTTMGVQYPFNSDYYYIGFEPEEAEGYDYLRNYSYLLDVNNQSKQAVNYRKLLDFIKIPVIKNQKVKLSAEWNSKTSTYNVKQTSYYSLTDNNDDNDFFSLYFNATADKNNIYFWFSNKTSKGNLVETSLIPGGYGIYVLPYRKTYKNNKPIDCSFDFDNLRNICPIDEKARIEDVYLDLEHGELLVYSSLDGKLRLCVVSTEGFEKKQEFETQNPDKLPYIGFIHSKGKELIHFSDYKNEPSENWVALKRDVNGKYSEVFQNALVNSSIKSFYEIQDFDVKDGRLVLLSIDSDIEYARIEGTDDIICIRGDENLYEERIEIRVISPEGNQIFYASMKPSLQKSNLRASTLVPDDPRPNSAGRVQINSASGDEFGWITLEELKQPKLTWK